MSFAKKRIRIICPRSGSKILFPSRESAETYLANRQKYDRHPERFQSTRIYYCEACGGYHTSTSAESRLNRMSPKARAETIRLLRTQKYSLIKAQNSIAESAAKPNLPLVKRRRASSSKKGTRNVIIGRIYRHFKGDYYKVLAVARHTDTNTPLVIYQLLYHEKQKIWARPYEEFLSEVDRRKYPKARQKYRFELISS